MKTSVTITAMRRLLGTFLLAAIAGGANAQGDLSQVEIVPHKLADNLYYLIGSGGNIGVSIGDDGVFLVDDQFAPLTEKIVAAVASLTDEPVRFVLNTHHHGDHVGGNANLANAGVVVIAHDNVRTTLAAAALGEELERALTAGERAGLPVVTFSDSVTFHINDEEVHAFHVPPAHTDGDSFVHFRHANVIHTGDVFRTTSYPRVDTNANGSFHGIMESYELLLEISDTDTVFLPGHGVPSSQEEVSSQLAMFRTIRDRVKTAMDEGRSLAQIQADGVTAEFDAQWGGAQAGSDLVAVIYAELQAM